MPDDETYLKLPPPPPDDTDPAAASGQPNQPAITPTGAPGPPEGAPPLPPPTPFDTYDASVRRVRTPQLRVNVVLFVLTLISSIYWGFLQYQFFYEEELRGVFTVNPLRAPDALLGGLPFGLAAIAFLLAHEMGHYLACRYYGISATLPYFIPLPAIPFIYTPGTLGAVIRITGPITSRRALFDIAVAGPIAGWITALPILAFGLSQSRIVDLVDIETRGGTVTWMGEPLIWKPMAALFGPETTAGQDLITHPLAYVGWFALLVTAMNLLPVGQLDGGHILYSFTSRHHRLVSIGVIVFMIYAGVRYFTGWLVFAVVILAVLGTRHPKPENLDQSLGGARILLALVATFIFVTSFMLVPLTMSRIF